MNFCMDLNAMVDDRAETGRRALGSLLREAQSAVRCCLAIPSRSC